VLAPTGSNAPVRFSVVIDEKAPGASRGDDLDERSTGVLVEPRLYQLIRQPGQIEDRTFEIAFHEPGAQAYAFTFG